jgi:RecB family exonuclease
MDYFQKNGVAAVKTPAVRAIGPDNSVIGYPDIIVVLPGVGLAVIEVKTGEIPTYTPNQTAYFPQIQIGGHIYTTDTRIAQLGLAPGVPFPPTPVYILHAPGPGREYDAWKLSPPQLEP